MTYQKQQWRNNDHSTPLSAERLNHMEEGIADAHSNTVGDNQGDVLWSELNPVLDGKAPVSHQHSWGDVTDKPDSYPPATHSHTPASIGAAPASHTHTQYATTAAVDGVSDRVTDLEESAPIIVSAMPSSPLPGRIYLVTE